jgi:RNA polymerase sigma-70 factor (ECF subfamily)
MPPKPEDPGSVLWIAAKDHSFSYPASSPSLDGFGEIYREHVAAVYRYFHARTGSVADAQDLTAETFFAALDGFPRYRSGKGTPIAWLMGIARHKLVDYFRRSSRSVPLEVIETEPGDQLLPEAEAGQALQLERVAEALHRINPARAEALTLHLYVGLCLDETAKALNKSPQAVKKLVQRGLADLRRALRPEEVD